ncbi:catalase [Mucilaginibacter paludis]|uniref:Catalase n=1 Tax=Mucilaginibacter paludis DSM 18603 TaxID=714943 RepID=H1Y1C8_9SPHI|nr:catalase [Mucilaginibacter paludis]EHQ30262.1 Catalase related subgroup domain-containing protein [Mucilaginibacter paludis DSM 18603]
MAKKNNNPQNLNKKLDDLAPDREHSANEFLTTDQGLRINDDTNSLKAGERGATLLEDFILREKITHFDHERIPERIVHARGSGAHGVFQVYESMAKYTKAGFLQDPSVQTPVFVRFSTVAGFRGSTDLARDVRGFAVKFYTEEGNFDFVGNNIPVFFIQDAIKFPDLIHAVKPEPHNEIPQAASAHDTFWDFISLTPESMHMIMWAMSDRALPRSLRMMEGFGIHTFRFINAEGKSCFVKFHWKPLLGMHAVAWDEAQKISGKNSDFHRQDLWEAIESGAFPEWEFGVQIIPEEDEHKYPFDLLDPTKLIPEELVPVMRIGKMTLNRNVDNFFAETEQVAFHPGHLVPGIDFTNDPLLQGRLFSYTDTQLSRLGSPNFHEIPINRSINPIHNNQRDGHMRQQINVGKSSYHPNTVGAGFPQQARIAEGGFTSYEERIDARKVRARSKSFMDFFSQATLFFNSQSEPEQNHIIDALRFELGKLETVAIRERIVGMLAKVSTVLAAKVAEGLGMAVPEVKEPLNHNYGADANPADYQDQPKKQIDKSPALSMANSPKDTIKTRQIAILAADGVDGASLKTMKEALLAHGAQCKLIAPHGGAIKDAKGSVLPVDMSFLTAASVVFDAVYVPAGAKGLLDNADAIHFINESYRHCKAIAADGDGVDLINETYVGPKLKKGKGDATAGVIIGKGDLSKDFIHAIAQHRFWEREKKDKVPA